MHIQAASRRIIPRMNDHIPTFNLAYIHTRNVDRSTAARDGDILLTFVGLRPTNTAPHALRENLDLLSYPQMPIRERLIEQPALGWPGPARLGYHLRTLAGVSVLTE